MDVAWLGKRLPVEDEIFQTKAAEMGSLIDQAINTVRDLAAELRPGPLDDLGLLAALEWQASHFSRRAGIPCHLILPSSPVDLGLEGNIAVFRIFQEALTNIARHAQATEINIRLTQSGSQFTLVVRDNGRGIGEADLNSAKSLGLVGMQERARALGGALTINGRPGKGTTIRLQFRTDWEKADGQR
jgi:signal transduction histidine kinase